MSLKLILVLVLIVVNGGILFFLFFNRKIRKVIEKWLTSIQPFLLFGFIILFIAAVIYFPIHFSSRFLPDPVTENGKDVVTMFNVTLIFTGIIFFVTQFLLFFFPFRYRAKPERKAYYFKNFYKLEFVWTIIPLVTFIFLFVWGQIVWAKVKTPPKEDALQIEIMGEQFNWRVRYPGKDHRLGKFNPKLINEVNDLGLDFTDPFNLDDFMPIQLHVPKGRKVRLMIRSRDVIHDVYIPYFRLKMDAVPGMLTHLHFTPTVTTAEMRLKLNKPDFNYELACAELCGRMHFAMKMIVVVEEPEVFDKWYNSQEPWLDKNPEYKQKIQNKYYSKLKELK